MNQPSTSSRNKTKIPKEQTSVKKLSWQKPCIQQLQISFDTTLFGGSNADATGRGTP